MGDSVQAGISAQALDQVTAGLEDEKNKESLLICLNARLALSQESKKGRAGP